MPFVRIVFEELSPSQHSGSKSLVSFASGISVIFFSWLAQAQVILLNLLPLSVTQFGLQRVHADRSIDQEIAYVIKENFLWDYQLALSSDFRSDHPIRISWTQKSEDYDLTQFREDEQAIPSMNHIKIHRPEQVMIEVLRHAILID